ncbi:MAG: SAM-dependent methyltransferase [Nannocystaceae bacterium]
MREGWPSLTALAVAVGRGIGTSPEQVDLSAADLVPSPLSRTLRWVGGPRAPWGMRSTLRLATLGMVDHVSLRTAAIDAALRQALATGIEQLVVLGAGLDGRAWRLQSLRETTVFEVDHPATQAGKRRRVAARPSLAAAVHFVAVDFERDSLTEHLEQAGHDAARPSVWIWEGVTPYLEPAAIEASLAAVASRSARSSRLIVSYAVPTLLPPRLARLDALTEHGFAALGEPLRGMISTERFAQLLAAHGFSMLEDSGNREWALRHPGSARIARLFSAERLAVAERNDDR